jgi:AraC family transcriptional activator FtrA
MAAEKPERCSTAIRDRGTQPRLTTDETGHLRRQAVPGMASCDLVPDVPGHVPCAHAELARRHPAVRVDPDVLYVADDLVMTSAGVAAGIDVCLHLVRLDHGADVAARVARRMVVAPHRDGGQAQYIRRPLPRVGGGLAATCDWALGRLDEPLTVTDLAARAGWSPRTLARRFVAETGTTPLRWLSAQRVLEARRLLESTDLSVDQVARRCGLGTAANLRLHLSRDAATTPSAYRRTFRGSRARTPALDGRSTNV